MDSVAEVLGDAVTAEVRGAWTEVYWLFATLLAAEEARLYQVAGHAPAAGFRPWRVTERREEAEDVVSFVLRPADGGKAAPHRPGQYVSVAVDLPGGLRQPRQYTLSRAADGVSMQITVRRVRGRGGAPDGAVSTYLHREVSAGDELLAGTPFGDVVLDDGPDPLVLVSAGIGITPIAAMLDHLAAVQPGRRVIALHADRRPAVHALRVQTAQAAGRMTDLHRVTWYEEPDAPGDGLVMAGCIDLGALTVRIPAKVFGPDLWQQAG
ncbi:hypothetical protein AGRA3207_002041 [Actinomadura graeca]|uniref:FAD-binding FR-type domain-containing protein n=1 Tax=Actinomadura graeca TaxID=2750812 RepID=A0ABX8QQY9_9ACTN|nr:FAD-binding oxidoreductase [Actinomadura graeca]QXJ21209.1 hypothetical protein AGRA3207_002041 [Actinomadura graeca]